MPEDVGKTIMAGNTPMEFTGNLLNGRRLIRAMKNPMDKCTIVSIFPREINEVKPTIEPGKFNIPAGSYEEPSLLIVGGSSWWKDIDADQPMLEMQRSSIEIANSVITDYCNSMLGCNMSDSMPGLFFVLGERNHMEVKMQYKEKLKDTKAKQDNWYRVLVRIADSLWARTQGNPLAIWDEMRLAAKSLNLDDKPWLKDFQMAQLVPCKACGALKNPSYPVCATCKAIDKEHPLSGDLKFSV